ncbi:hypothetical protein P9D34_01150 [Bacillus swezeyi]|uniref:Uncharacterized protein n=2 Tax=Bacillus swezeyi TaxID=1925020 RepID=A0A1R1S1T2_9BACI|nr:hypothetical protein [Bacillus swezeyi]MEC1259066.1 hypothetical protein [Bacillus swezeyi]MED2927973.1 hypothetical protein [Bacillus swezeyi]MED2942233.1 hypothetical protein [Bacillus swezeyi]MED2965115.1 hypothetical protein [Bacillus swezeyi]MED2977780.1 hypothetical protein [Bacillus swezeyi]
MDTLKLSIEELIFCFYSEGLFEQGMSLKQAYFPDMTEEQLEFMFEISCRSLLAKDVLEYKAHQYKLKEPCKPFIQALNDADYTIKASKFSDEAEESVSYHVASQGLFAHQLIHEQQVHHISSLSSKEDILEQTVQFLNIKEEQEAKGTVLTLQNDQFEQLLKGASEERLLADEFLVKYADHPHAKAFIQDLVFRQGKMDSVMLVEYGLDNTPDVRDLMFVIPGAEHTWFVTGSARNEFSVMVAEKEKIRNIILRDSRLLR